MTETRPKLSSSPSRRSIAERLLDDGVRLLLHLRVPVAAERLDERTASRDVELVHEPLLAEMEVHRALVDGRVGALVLDDAEHRAGARVHDRERVRARRAQRNVAGGVVLARVHPAARRLAQVGHERRALERDVAERVAVVVVDRSFERGGGEMPVEHARICVIEDGSLDAAAEQRLRLPHEVLVERVLRRDEDCEPVAATAGAAPLLPQARDRAGEADADGAVEQADVDSELERVRCRDAEQLAFDESSLDLPSLLRRVTGAVRREPRRRLGVDAVDGHAMDELCCLAALREADRPESALHELGREARRLSERRRT